MGRKNVPVKTKEGTLEIKARALGLAPRIRTALLLVDGVKSVAELEQLMAAAGVTVGALQLLLDKGLIRFPEDDTHGAVPATPNAAIATVNSAKAMPIRQATTPNTLARAETSVATANVASRSSSNRGALLPPSLHQPSAIRAPLEIVPLTELKTILGVATKLEMDTILGVATMLELTPTQMQIPKAAGTTPISEPVRLPSLAHAGPTERLPPAAALKATVPASVLRMNLIVARAHIANVLDQFLEINGYLLKQKVMACESRAEFEQLFCLIEAALTQKMDKPTLARNMEATYALLER